MLKNKKPIPKAKNALREKVKNKPTKITGQKIQSKTFSHFLRVKINKTTKHKQLITKNPPNIFG